MRLLSRLLLVAVLAPALALSAPALAQSQDNTAIAENTKDGKSVFKLAFSVKKVTGDVDATNTAVAYSSCTDCKTVAVAIQVVLVSGDVGDVTPQNVAIAINYDCTECETLARAFQFVYGDGQELEFTKEGKARLHDLRKRFHDLKQRDDLTLAQLAAEINAIAREVANVVTTETEVKKASDATTTTTTASSSTTTTVAASTPTSTSVTTSTTRAPTTTTIATTTTAAPSSTTTTTAAP